MIYLLAKANWGWISLPLDKSSGNSRKYILIKSLFELEWALAHSKNLNSSRL